MSSIYIPERFKKTILLHIFKNLWSAKIPSVPLILGIHGPSGWGKSFQCEHILNSIGAKVSVISGGQLESKDAGEPARLIRYTYKAAGDSTKQKIATDGRTIIPPTAKISVLLINDVDTGLGNWGDNVQKTINTQTVFGELMHLTDYPTIVENKETQRIPIILTGNDFTKLYSPLIRAGRMTSFVWSPNIEEKTDIVKSIFSELTKKECEYLVNTLESQINNRICENKLNIAFFSHLRSILYDDAIWNIIIRHRVEDLLEKSTNGNAVPIFNNINFSLPNILEKGTQLITSSKHINHLIGG
jgi:SpoVK/Ycf46/Vps4 family AAA+-type ATPase